MVDPGRGAGAIALDFGAFGLKLLVKSFLEYFLEIVVVWF